VIGAQVEIGEESSIGAHVVIEGRTRIGRRNRIFHFASIGAPPQDKKYGRDDHGRRSATATPSANT
jgi:UDP-N-acetylglucosamine acyltransferase